MDSEEQDDVEDEQRFEEEENLKRIARMELKKDDNDDV